MNHPSSGWFFGLLLSCSIHSLMYGEQCRIETPANSHAFRKRTPSISTSSSSPRSNVTRAPPRSTSDFNSSRCSDRSCPLRQIRLPRLSATCLIFSVMVSALKNSRTNAITQTFKIATICDSVNLDFLVRSPVPGESTVCLESEPGEPTISIRQHHYRETNPPSLRSCRDGRALLTSSAQILLRGIDKQRLTVFSDEAGGTMAEVGLLPFARVALQVATQVLPRYRTRFSKHQFTQPQLLAVLCLMRYEDWTFREAEVRLREHQELRAVLQLPAVPD